MNIRRMGRAASLPLLIIALALASVTSTSRAVAASTNGAGSARATSSATGEIAFYNDPGNGSPKQLYVEHADGTGLRQLVHSTSDDVLPTISPDGTHVVFVRQPITSSGAHGTLPDKIIMVGIHGKGLHRVNPGGCPKNDVCGDDVEGHAFSPDGKRLVFTRAVFPDPNGPPAYVELWTCNLDGSHAFRLTRESGTAQDGSASWSPDGTHIVFLHWIYGTPDQFRIATINRNGTDMDLITPAGLDGADPSYSPNGNVILFQSPPDPTYGVNQVLYTVRPDGTGLKTLAKNLTGIASNHASWSPDGRQILFCHIPLGSKRGADLYLINRDGTHLHRLARTPLTENGAFWGTTAHQS